MRTSFRCAALAAAAIAAARAHEPVTTKLTWTQEISRVVYKHCISCHREGGGAPMPLVTYNDARPWAKPIRDEVLERRMPPWDAVKGVGRLKNDRSLSQPEIDLIVSWVEGGAPEGDSIYLPPVPEPDPPESPSKTGVRIKVAAASAQFLSRDTTLVAVAPDSLPEGGSLELIAVKPDGAVEPLIWLRNYRARSPAAYAFAEPLRFPRGTRLAVHATSAAAAALVTIAPPGP